MGSPANSALGPPPIETPISPGGSQHFGIPFAERGEVPVPSASLSVGWAAWFNSLYAWIVATMAQLLTFIVNPMTLLGDTIYENATPKAAKLAGNITTTPKALMQTGTGAASAAPGWVDPTTICAAIGFPGTYASLRKISQSGNLVATSIQHNSAVLPYGMYLVAVYVSGTPTGAASISGTLAWIDDLGIAGSATFSLSGSSAFWNLASIPIICNGVNNLAVATTVIGTVNYNLTIAVLRLE
jgi:hypothetical protein